MWSILGPEIEPLSGAQMWSVPVSDTPDCQSKVPHARMRSVSVLQSQGCQIGLTCCSSAPFSQCQLCRKIDYTRNFGCKNLVPSALSSVPQCPGLPKCISDGWVETETSPSIREFSALSHPVLTLLWRRKCLILLKTRLPCLRSLSWPRSRWWSGRGWRCRRPRRSSPSPVGEQKSHSQYLERDEEASLSN